MSIILTEDLDDEIVKPDLTELEMMVHRYNHYMSDKMTYHEISDGYYQLRVNGTVVTNGDHEEILERVKGIVRENGLMDL